MIGEIVGNFRLVSKIGRGGMGDVFLGEHTTGGTRVAIKVLKSDLSADNEYVQRLFNEARAVNEIRHQGVVQVFDVGIDDRGRAFLVMELLEGRTLGRVLTSGTRLTLEQVVSVTRQIAVILEATHAVGITHRDLKPENIFLLDDPSVTGGLRVKVLDFGIAKLTGTLKSGVPTTQVSLGTPAYMAPEQWGDPSKIDGRVDLYALGCVLFEMACGRPPFPATTMAEACAAHVGAQPPRARSIAPNVPVALDALVDRLLAKAAEERAVPREIVQVCDSLVPNRAAVVRASDPRMTQSTGFPARGSAPALATPVAGVPARLPMTPGAPLPTLDVGAAQVATTVRKPSRAPLFVIVGGLAVAGTIAAVIALQGSTPSTAAPKADGKIDLRAAKVENKPPPQNARMQETIAEIEKLNPFVDKNGVTITTRFVTQKEYALYIAALPTEEQQREALPLGMYDASAETPVRSVTWEQADKFCTSIGAKLLTSDRWETLVGNDTDGKLKPGDGLREWTSSRTNDGRRIVRGAFDKDEPSKIEDERPWLFRWHTEASNRGRSPVENVASEQIGFRCTK